MDSGAEALRPQRASADIRECRTLAELSSDLHLAVASFLNAQGLSAFVAAAPWMTRGALSEQCLGTLYLELTERTWVRRGGVGQLEGVESYDYEVPTRELEASIRHRAAFGLHLPDTAETPNSPLPLSPSFAGRAAEEPTPAGTESRSVSFAEQAARALRVSCQRAYALLPPHWPRGFDQSQLSPSPRHRIDLLDDQGMSVFFPFSMARQRSRPLQYLFSICPLLPHIIKLCIIFGSRS